MQLKLWAAVLCSEYLLPGVPLLLLTLQHWNLLLNLSRDPEPRGMKTGRVQDIWEDQKIEKTREICTDAAEDADPLRLLVGGGGGRGWTSVFTEFSNN